ncbi:MAG TPA: tRNA (N(6)-L-threonylcarbamoyladenosine(37)-C(2))-methylthiotransferase MtaB [Bacilli bacterium]|nr:tRNA (N(6)-L-threonylcarbamoyladenosine(37)-C(2))-methylthiotransferase MtaB [Bacilli bacterium]
MRISYCSLGCKVNLYETAAIINEFVEKGYKLVDFNEVSDIYIINTCTVTATADAKSRKMIRQAVKKNPEAVVAVMGCFSQLNADIVKSIPGVDIVLGTSNRHKLLKLIEECLVNNKKSCYITDYKDIKEYEELKVSHFTNKTRGFVKIQDGCNNFCSYCVIPYARGQIRSRKGEDVIAEVAILTAQGMKEIVLTGINTGTYGQDLSNYTLSNLLEDIAKKVPNLGRLRISSIEATEISDELLQTMSENRQHFCLHLHVPLQGGADNVLKRMNRKYDISYFREKIAKIRAYFPDINITTDCLAGFNGETNEDFIATKDFIAEMNFGEMHVFPFSPRPKTKAYALDNPIDAVTKKNRVDELLALNQSQALAYRKRFVGQVLAVIVEKNEQGLAFGHSSNYLEIEFPDETAKPNDLVLVKITKANYPISKGVVSNE